jgi:hypothetical protein
MTKPTIKVLNEKASRLSFRGADVKDYDFHPQHKEVYIHLKKGALVTDLQTGKQYLIDNDKRQFIAKKYVDKADFVNFEEAFIRYKDAAGKPTFFPDSQIITEPANINFNMIDSFLLEEEVK